MTIWELRAWEWFSQNKQNFLTKGPLCANILSLFLLFGFFEPKIDQKTVENLTFCAKYEFEILSIFFFTFPYSNKSENLCNNFDFLKINKTKKFGSKNSGLFCNLQAILIYMLPEAFISMLWKQIYFGK